MMLWAEILIKNGRKDDVLKDLWHLNDKTGAIQKDIDYVLSHWTEATCDLWEEIRAGDLFWNQMAYHHTLTKV